MNNRDKIHSAINEHIDVDDTYAYFLTRDKSSFSVGTVTLDDFEEWTDSDVADLTDSIMEKINPELNENQQVVLEWLKKNAEWGTPTGLIYELTKRNSMAAEYIITAHDQLNKLEQFQLLAALAEWGMKEVAK